MGLFRLQPGFRRGSSSSSEDEHPPAPPPNTHRVKRALFGPTDHEENLRFVKNELKKARSEASSRWNFDFDTGKPLCGTYDWEEVKSPTASRSVINTEKHSSVSPLPIATPSPATVPPLPDSSEAAKENRVSDDGSLLSSEPSVHRDDLKTPPSQSSTQTSQENSKTTCITGTRSKERTSAHEKKLTDVYPSRKPRSKSSTNLKLKRLAGNPASSSRSPSVKSRVNLSGAVARSTSDSSQETDNEMLVNTSSTKAFNPVTLANLDDASRCSSKEN